MTNTTKNLKEIDVNSLIALCEIENYDIFCKELESLIVSDKLKNSIFKIYDIMQGKQGKFTLATKKYKNFVKKYQDVIEIMIKHQCLGNMTVLKYDTYGEVDDCSTEDYFFKFIAMNKDNIETIKAIATKIKKLGFNKIIYDEKLDFTNTEYKLYTSFGSSFEYLENIELIPTYNNDPIKYKTTDSCYRMTIGRNYDKSLTSYSRKIELNSLIFDPNRLPDEITTESTVDLITKLAEDSKADCKKIENSVDISVAVSDLFEQYDDFKRIIKSIESTKTKEELNEILNYIFIEMTKLKSVSSSFDEEVIKSSENIDEEKLALEKKLYLSNRRSASIHDCW